MYIKASILDAMIIAGVIYLQSSGIANLPVVPIFSMLGAIALTIIEIKSICEKSEEKGDLSQATKTIRELLESPSLKTFLSQLEKKE